MVHWRSRHPSFGRRDETRTGGTDPTGGAEDYFWPLKANLRTSTTMAQVPEGQGAPQ
jgi:hypothetical protein